jgi:hypothetical protein
VESVIGSVKTLTARAITRKQPNKVNRSFTAMVSSPSFSTDEQINAYSSPPSKVNSKVNTIVSMNSHVTSNSRRISSEQEFNLRNVDSLKFVMQIIITFFMLMLCWNGLQQHEDDNTRALYWGGLTGIIGWWMPSPGSSRSTSDSKKS